MRATAANITTKQIRELRTESAEAGDLLQVIICDIALGYDARAETIGLVGANRDKVLRFSTQEKARAECARVIADAEAQAE